MIQTKEEAQRRVDRITAFRGELVELEQEQILVLTGDQHRRLDAYFHQTLDQLAQRFDVDTTDSQKKISMGMRVVTILGGAALCISVFLLFYRFWGAMPTALQVVLLTAAPLVALAGTELAARREKTLFFAAILAMIAFASFVLDLNVLGQTFNLTPSPMALLVWGLFAMALAYHYGLTLLLTAGLVCMTAFGGAAMFMLEGYYWPDFLERPENLILVGVAMFALPYFVRHDRRPSFPDHYRALGLLAVFLPVVVLSESGRVSFLTWNTVLVEKLYQFVGLFGSGAVIWTGIRQRWSHVVNIGSMFFAVFLFMRLYHWLWDAMPKYLFFLLVGIVALLFGTLFRMMRKRLGEQTI